MSILERLEASKKESERRLEELKANSPPNDEGLKVKTVVNIIGFTIFVVGVLGLLALYAC